jgi:hypothetical protein
VADEVLAECFAGLAEADRRTSLELLGCLSGGDV